MRKLFVTKELMASRSFRAEAGCLVWLMSKDKCGYGRISPQDGEVLAHRVMYKLAVGPIAHGMHVLHKCDNPSCIEPSHLFLGTHQDNMTDRNKKGRARHGSLVGLQSPAAKLTPSNLREIFASQESATALAKKFCVSQSTVSRVRNGSTYGNFERI